MTCRAAINDGKNAPVFLSPLDELTINRFRTLWASVGLIVIERLDSPVQLDTSSCLQRREQE